MPDSRLHQLSALGQSVWIDYLSRDLLHTGELARMMDEDAVTRRDLEPDDLPEGDLAGERLRRRSCATCSSTRRIRRRSSSRSPAGTSARPAT